MTLATRLMAIGLVALLGACDDADGSGSGTDTEATASGSTSGDAQTSASSTTAASGNPSATSSDDETSSAASTGADTSAGVTTDPTHGSTSSDAESGSGSESGGDEGGGSIDVTLTGCDIDFGGTIVVSYNGSLGVASVYDSGASLTGSFQFDLDGVGSMQLSSQHRVDTGNVVNMVDIGQGTWTNLDSDALADGEDSIGGTLDVDVWNPSRGQAELTFNAVSLMNVGNGNVCTIDGTVIAEELYP